MAKYKRRFADKIEDRDPDIMWMDCGYGHVIRRGDRYQAFWGRDDCFRDADILFQTQIIHLGERVERGEIVSSTTHAWSALREELLLDPSLFEYFPSFHRKFEEFIAGGYRAAHWSDVILSPRSGDGGFDIAAWKRGRRVHDEAKAYKPSLLVNHQIVRAALGLLIQHKGIDQVRVTTTSGFAPTIPAEFKHLIPEKLDLRDQHKLFRWLQSIGPSSV